MHDVSEIIRAGLESGVTLEDFIDEFGISKGTVNRRIYWKSLPLPETRSRIIKWIRKRENLYTGERRSY